MSKINDIFDIPQEQQTTEASQIKVQKERKKVIMTDEKKNALLERLAKGRETRANNLLAKKGLIDKSKSEEIKEDKVKLKTQPKVEPTVNNSEDERKAFINTMVGKSKPVEKFERPKKKIITESLVVEAPKVVVPAVVAPAVVAPKQSLVVVAPKVVASAVVAPKIVAPPKQSLVVVAPPKQSLVVVAPVVFSTLKKPMWG